MPPLDDERYAHFGGLITAIVRQCYRTLFPSHVPPDAEVLAEWTQVAWATLLADVLPRYDPQHASQAKLSTYAVPRIQGALRDYLAVNTLIRVPRQRLALLARRQLAEIDRVCQHWQTATGRLPTPEEVTAQVGLTPDQIAALRHEARRAGLDVVPVETHVVPDTRPTPEAALMDWQTTQQLHQCVERLPPRLKTIVQLIEWQGMSLREVGAVLALSKDTVRVRLQQALTQVQQCVTTERFVWPVDEPSPAVAQTTGQPRL